MYLYTQNYVYIYISPIIINTILNTPKENDLTIIHNITQILKY